MSNQNRNEENLGFMLRKFKEEYDANGLKVSISDKRKDGIKTLLWKRKILREY